MTTESESNELDRVTEIAAQIKKVRRDYTDLMATMRDAIRAADMKHSRNQIVTAAQGGLSRKKVYEVLGAADLLADAKDVLGRRTRWTVFEQTPGVVELSVDVAADAPYETEEFENGAVARDARELLRQLQGAGIEAVGDDPVAALEAFEDVRLIHTKET